MLVHNRLNTIYGVDDCASLLKLTKSKRQSPFLT